MLAKLVLGAKNRERVIAVYTGQQDGQDCVYVAVLYKDQSDQPTAGEARRHLDAVGSWELYVVHEKQLRELTDSLTLDGYGIAAFRTMIPPASGWTGKQFEKQGGTGVLRYHRMLFAVSAIEQILAEHFN